MLALAVVAFVACDDDDEGLNGWTDTAYVYVQGETLGNDMLKQAVVIETEGLEDATPCVYTFRACINKPAKADATVSLTAWSGTLGEGVENVIGNIFDGNTGSDIAANSAPWEFTLDLGAETTMLGANTRHWGSGYAPRSIEVLTSPDNATWKSHGTLAVSGGTQNWRFLKPVTARYLRYRVMSPNGRTDVTEFNIYVAKQ